MLEEVSVSPRYAQIVIEDAEPPFDWLEQERIDTTKPVLAGQRTIHVFTIPDHIGDVLVFISHESPEEGWQAVYDGPIRTSSGKLVITQPDMAGGYEGEVDLEKVGEYRLQIFTKCEVPASKKHLEGSDQPDHVWVRVTKP